MIIFYETAYGALRLSPQQAFDALDDLAAFANSDGHEHLSENHANIKFMPVIVIFGFKDEYRVSQRGI